MITYKQWKTVNESFVSTFGSVLTQPVVVGGVVGATGASDWSLEETKAKIRKYMLGEEDEGEGDSGDPKPKKKSGGDKGGAPKPKKSGGSPFGGGGGGFGGDDDDDDQDDDDQGGFGGDDDDDQDDDQGGDDGGFGGDDDDDDMGGDPMGGMGGDKPCPTCGKSGGKPGMGDPMGGKPGMGKPGMGGDLGMDDDDDQDGMGGDGGFGGDDDDQDDMGGMGGDDDMGGDDMGGMGDQDDMGGDPMGGMGGGDDMGGMGDLGASAKGNVCDKCGHHEADKNAKFCKMCGKGMSKFMKKYMSADGGVSINGKKALPWLNKSSDNGEIKKGGRQTGKEMSTTVKGGKKDPGREPNSAGGRVPAVRAKNESLRICTTCGSLGCEIHTGKSPSADHLNKSFFKSLSNQVGSRGGKFDNGMHDSVVEDALYVPKTGDEEHIPFPGEIGYAPTGRIGGFLG